MKEISKKKFSQHLEKLHTYTIKNKVCRYGWCFLYVRLVELSKIYFIAKRELKGSKPKKYYYTDLKKDMLESGKFSSLVISNINNRNKLVHRISSNLTICQSMGEISEEIIKDFQTLKELVDAMPSDINYDEDFKSDELKLFDKGW